LNRLHKTKQQELLSKRMSALNLANRDKKLSKEIDAIAKDLLGDVSLDEVADSVQSELESLAVEDVWDRSGARRDGYVDTGETAWQMFEAALEPFREDMLKYEQLSMLEQAEAVCSQED
jgi:hypothetical protein